MPPNLITSNPKVMMGKPAIAGARITVERILEKLAAGETPSRIVDAYPRLTVESVEAAVAFAAETVRSNALSPAEKVLG